MHDIIIVGGGHNGLTCAAYLARAGKRVLVLEANPHVGGFCVTGDVPGAPGFRMNTYAMEFPFAGMRPSVADELGLSRHGLKWTYPDPNNTYLGQDGVTWSLWYDLERTCSSIARLSRRDAARYRRLMQSLIDLAYALIPYFMDHPTRPSPRTIASLIRRMATKRKSLGPGARIMMSSGLEVIDGFEREEVKALLALNCATGSFQPLDEPTSNSYLVAMAFMHLVPLRRPFGGAGAFSEALAACVRASGGEVRTSSPVEQIIVRNGKATGVVLQNDQELQAQQVVAAIDPVSLFTRLLESSSVPSTIADEVDHIQMHSAGISILKGDLAVARRPRFKHSLPDSHFAGVTMCPSVDCVQKMLAACARGELAEELPVYTAVPSVLDRTLVPPSSDGDSLFIWVGAVPYALSHGRDWADVKDGYLNKAIDRIDEYAPGLRESIVGVHVRSPRELNHPWACREHSRGVDLVPSQLGPWRPSPSLAGYRTPIESLWHTGHGAHPMSGTNGWSGRTAARTLLKQVEHKRWRHP